MDKIIIHFEESGERETGSSQNNDVIVAQEQVETASDSASLCHESSDSTQSSNTPVLRLHIAAQAFNTQEVEKLITDGYDVNETDSNGRNTVHAMLESYAEHSYVQQVYSKPQFIEILSVLVRNRLNINSTDNHKRTALHFIASRGDYVDIIKPLLAAGIQVNAQDFRGHTALHSAILKGFSRNAQVLVEGGANTDLIDNNGNSALHVLCKGSRKLPLIKLLIRCGANVNIRDAAKRTPLHIAVRYGRLGTVRELLACKAHVNSSDTSGQTALHYAMKYDLTGQIVEELLAHKATVNMQDAVYQETALHKAITHGNIEAFKRLVAYRNPAPNPNLPDYQGETVLHRAAAMTEAGSTGAWNAVGFIGTQLFIWQALLRLAGVDVGVVNDVGMTAMQKAARLKNTVALGLFREYGMVMT